MWAGLRVCWQGVRHWNRRGYLYVWANVFWALLTVLIVTAPAAWAGLTRLSYVAHRQPLVSLDDFWQGVRENLLRSIPLAAINVLLVVTTYSNLASYADEPGLGFLFLRGVWVLSLILWLLAQFFGWCFFYAMKKPTFIGGLRNAVVMMINHPLFCAGVTVGVLLVGALSTMLAAAWFLITGGILVSIANSAVQDRLRLAGIEPGPAFEEGSVVDPEFGDV